MSSDKTKQEYNYDVVIYKSAIPAPDALINMRESLHDMAFIEEEGNKLSWHGKKKCVSVSHEDTDTLVTATKLGRKHPWLVRLEKTGSPDVKETDGFYIELEDNSYKLNSQNVLQKIVDQLSFDLIGVSALLAKVKGHKLEEEEVISADVGDPRSNTGARNIKFNKESYATDNNYMEVEVNTKDMPDEFNTNVDRAMSSATIRDDFVRVGNHVFGEVIAEKDKNGTWCAIGGKRYGYDRGFGKGMSAENVALEIAQDMAVDRVDPDAYDAYIRLSKISEENINNIKLGGEVVYEKPEDLDMG